MRTTASSSAVAARPVLSQPVADPIRAGKPVRRTAADAGDQSDDEAVERALANASRAGFRLAVFGRNGALLLIAIFYLTGVSYPNNMPVAGLIMASCVVGFVALARRGRRGEHVARYALFGFDMMAIGALVAFVPISAGADIPQNFVFLSSRETYVYIVAALSVLTLSPGLVLWTGLCGVVGLAGAVAWIIAGMERVASYSDLPPSFSSADFLAIAHDPNFLNVPVRIGEGLVTVLVTAITALAVQRARHMVRAHAAAESKRRRAHLMFGRYVPAQVADQLLDTGQLAPQMREATVLFADIEGFTGLSESLSPAAVIALLDSFFGAATMLIDKRGGVVINHIGDAFIAAFNAPLPATDHAVRAVDAAIALQALVSARSFEGHRLRLRIGIATGQVAAGIVGGSTRQTYTLYGDTVNVAQRLERLNKELGSESLICGATFDAARPDARAVGSVLVPGRRRAVDVFALAAGQPIAPTGSGMTAAA